MLPSFQQIRRVAYQLLSDVEEELQSNWRPSAGPSAQQAEAVRRALLSVADAKAALREAARRDW